MDFIDELSDDIDNDIIEDTYVYTPADDPSGTIIAPLTAANLNVLENQITDNGSTA